MRVMLLILIFIICYPLSGTSQNERDLPYQGGAAQFNKEVQASLIVETGNPGRVYLIEISYSKTKKKVEFVIHGAKENDLTTMLVRSFFKQRMDKWDKKFLKKSDIIIPLFISPVDIYNSNAFLPTPLNEYAETIARSFNSKSCFLYKPVYIFRQETQIDIEPDWEQ